MIRRLFFELRYLFGNTPWDSGISPPELLSTLAQRQPGRALDLGCGTGTNVITLAQHGWQALGVDFSAGAVAEARRRLRAAGVQAELLAADVTRLDPLRLGEPFDLLLDIGCFHALSPKGRGRYAAQLPALVRPGALFLLYTFLSSQTGDNWPSEAQLRHHFKPDFHIERFERGHDHAGRRESAWLWLACNS